jgi:hypothetical protein
MFNFSGITPNPSTRHAGHGSTSDYTKGLPFNEVYATKKKDRLTGAAYKSNTFTYTSNSLSLLKDYDTITNYAPTDSLDSPFVTEYGYSIEINIYDTCVNLTKLNAQAIAKECLTKSTLPAYSAGAFTVTGYDGTFVVLNDSNAGFQANKDALVFLKGYYVNESQFTINVV